MNEKTFQNLIYELIEENPFAIRAVLKILSVEFTSEVPTLCVTREEKPRLQVNLEFISKNCANEKEVKAVICHEFLHVLLRHTENREPLTDAEHLAMDAVINAIIHRELGSGYSSMMSRYYANAENVMKLLRPMTRSESDYDRKALNNLQWKRAWGSLYEGKLVVDDIKELAEEFTGSLTHKTSIMIVSRLLGNHRDFGKPLPAVLEEALSRTMRSMNGGGIWRSPKSRGVGATPYNALFTETNIAMDRWKQTTLSVLKKHLLPNQKGKLLDPINAEFYIPVLSSQDRRAFIRSLWNPFIPDALWTATRYRASGLAQVYLDVSGSMNAEMPYIIALLNQLRRYIKMPFWAFSDEVAPAMIEAGQLTTSTSGGTSLSCVLAHLAKTQPDSAVIVTDGYIEQIQPQDVKKIQGTKVHALVVRDGNATLLARAGIAYTQLERIPK